MKKNYIPFIGALAVLSLAACSHGDVYNADDLAAYEAAQQKARTEANIEKFKVNFVEKYGAVATNQSWDFASGQQYLATRAEDDDEIVVELVDGLDFGITNEMVSSNANILTTRTITKNVELFNRLNEMLPDNKKQTGEAVVLLAPSSDFTIYPLCMQAGWTHELYVKVGDNEPFKVYTKDWTTFGRQTVNGDVTKLKKGSTSVEKRALLPGVHIKAPIGTRVDVYLDKIQGEEGNVAGTTNGQAIYLDCDVKPEGITMHEDAVIKYIGIEDNKTSGSDNDFNDVALAVVGNPYVPEKITFSDGSYDVPLAVCKRYMIEDLGTTDDFDFNDVVVDVKQTTVTHHKVQLANGRVISDVVEGTSDTQEAIIRHLGGTLPFKLTIGETTLEEMGSQATFMTSPDLKYEVKGWSPALNNVSIEVNQVTIPFPSEGSVPMIFACDTTYQWSEERVAVDFQTQFPGYIKVK